MASVAESVLTKPIDYNLTGGVAQGAALATHIENVRQNREKLNMEKQKHQIALGDHFMNSLQSTIGMPEGVRQARIKQLQGEMARNGVAIDPGFIDAVTDPEHTTQMIAATNHIMGLPDDQKSQAYTSAFAMGAGGYPAAIKYITAIKGEQAKIAMAQASMNFKERSLDNRITQSGVQEAGKNPQIAADTMRLDGTLRMKEILADVRSGKIKDTSQIKSMLGLEQAKLEAGTNNMGVNMAEHQTEIKTMSEEFNNNITRVFGKILGGNLSPDQLDQSESVLDTFSKSYMSQFDSHARSIKDTDPRPEVKTIVQNMVDSQHKNYANRFGDWYGMDQVNGPAKGASAYAADLPPSARKLFAEKLGPNWRQDPKFIAGFQAKKGGGTATASATPGTGAAPSSPVPPAQSASPTSQPQVEPVDDTTGGAASAVQTTDATDDSGPADPGEQ